MKNTISVLMLKWKIFVLNIDIFFLFHNNIIVKSIDSKFILIIILNSLFVDKQKNAYTAASLPFQLFIIFKIVKVAIIILYSPT